MASKQRRVLPAGIKTLGVVVAFGVGSVALLMVAYLLIRKTDAQCRREAACEQAGLCSAKLQSCVAATSSDCAHSQNCREYGECSAHDGKCIVASDADCAAICKTSDRCIASGGRCVCDPKRAAACIEIGKCGVDDRGWCTTFTTAGCKASSKCARDGSCSLAPSRKGCVAACDRDCTASDACRKDGRCHAKGGICTRLACKESEGCKAEGRCTERGQKCVALRDEDCAGSTWCKQMGRCGARDGRCRATEAGCKASQKCKEDGACFVSTDGDVCVVR